MKRSATHASLPGRPEYDLTTSQIPREALLRLPEVVRLTGLSETVIYEKIAAGQFPLAKQVSTRVVAWPAARVLDWMAALPDVAPGRLAVQRKAKA